jgi:abhydrolase domain-containing protein 13
VINDDKIILVESRISSLGMMTENLQNKHIFSNDEPENTHTLERTPDEYEMDYQAIYLQTPDGEFIHAYWIYQSDEVESPLTMLYLHGAGGNISHRLEVLRMFYENLRCNILIIDYRGS